VATKKHGRRAASTPVKTPLTELTEALSANSGAVGRRAAVVAAAGGLIVTVGLPAANQAGKDDGVVSASAEAADQSEIEFTNQAKLVVPEAAEAKDGEGEDAGDAAQAEPVTATAAPEPAPAPSTDSSSDSNGSSGATSDRGSSSSRSSDRSSGDSVKVPNGSKAQQVISVAKQYVGVPYVYGGTSPSGWDCSGFTSFVYSKVGVNLPRTSGGQKAAGTVVSASEAKPGDLVYRPGHIGIYAGNGMMYDAGSSSSDTSYRSHSWMGSVTYIRVL
jgi:peptidoglycan DL-endopeptidase CwlO